MTQKQLRPEQHSLFSEAPYAVPTASESDGDLNFRPIQYLGSKFRFLEPIASAVDSAMQRGTQVCDLFSGSGVVAHRLAERYSVLAVDIQEYSRVLTSALLEPVLLDKGICSELAQTARALTSDRFEGLAELMKYEGMAHALVHEQPELLADIVERGSMYARAESGLEGQTEFDSYLTGALSSVHSGPETVMTRYYGGVYFSYAQAAQLDALGAAIRPLHGRSSDTAKAALLSTASHIAASVGGHFAQPIRPRSKTGAVKSTAVAAIARRRELNAIEVFAKWLDRYQNLKRRHGGIALRSDYRRVVTDLPEQVGLVYADPPYTRDHYSRFYHVLETLALGDEPSVSRARIGGEDVVSRGLYREERHQSPFCIKSEVRAAFTDLMEPIADQGVSLVLSYSPFGSGSASRPRLMTIEDLQELSRVYFSDVKILPTGHFGHNKLNARHLNSNISYDAEILLVCRV